MAEIDPRLEPLYLIADLATAQERDLHLPSIVSAFLRGGGRMVSLRARGVDDRAALTAGRDIAAQVSAAGGLFLVHQRVDLAILLAADGVHLPSQGFTPDECRRIAGRNLFLGRSTHSPAELHSLADRPHRSPHSFFTLGPFFSSISKPGYGPQLPLSALQNLPGPVYALGGITPDNAPSAVASGAFGVAVLGGILFAEDPARATRAYLSALT